MPSLALSGLMAWKGLVMGVGIVFIVIGLLALVAGLGIAIIVPDAMEDEQDDNEDPDLFSDGDESGDAEDRQEARAGGLVVTGLGAVATVVGGILFAIARGAEAES